MSFSQRTLLSVELFEDRLQPSTLVPQGSLSNSPAQPETSFGIVRVTEPSSTDGSGKHGSGSAAASSVDPSSNVPAAIEPSPAIAMNSDRTMGTGSITPVSSNRTPVGSEMSPMTPVNDNRAPMILTGMNPSRDVAGSMPPYSQQNFGSGFRPFENASLPGNKPVDSAMVSKLSDSLLDRLNAGDLPSFQPSDNIDPSSILPLVPRPDLASLNLPINNWDAGFVAPPHDDGSFRNGPAASLFGQIFPTRFVASADARQATAGDGATAQISATIINPAMTALSPSFQSLSASVGIPSSLVSVLLPALTFTVASETPTSSESRNSLSVEPNFPEGTLPVVKEDGPIEANLLRSIPLAGLLGVDIHQLENGARHLMSAVTDLSEELSDDFELSAEVAWFSTAVVLSSGAGYLLWMNRSVCRPGRGFVGPAKGTALWGEEHDRPFG